MSSIAADRRATATLARDDDQRDLPTDPRAGWAGIHSLVERLGAALAKIAEAVPA